MKVSKLKATASVLSIALLMGGCTTIGPDGKSTVDKGNTAMLGAGIGALLGAAIGGEKGAMLGAALGGGIGFVAGLEAQKQELETARLAAAELSAGSATTLALTPTVHTQNYQDTKTGESVAGLKFVDVPLPLAQMLDKKGELTEKGVATLAKLQAVAAKTGGAPLEIAIPSNSKLVTMAAITKAAPGAKVTIAEGKNAPAVARIGAKPVDASGTVKVQA